MRPEAWVTNLSDKYLDWTALIKAGGQPHNLTVLELGPGCGVDALFMAHTSRYWLCVDNDLDVLNWVKQLAPTVDCKQMDLTVSWPLESDVFDLVLDFSTLDDCGETLLGYSEACRVTRPGGYFVVTFANRRFLKETKKGTAFLRTPNQLRKIFIRNKMELIWISEINQPRVAAVVQKLGR